MSYTATNLPGFPPRSCKPASRKISAMRCSRQRGIGACRCRLTRALRAPLPKLVGQMPAFSPVLHADIFFEKIRPGVSCINCLVRRMVEVNNRLIG